MSILTDAHPQLLLPSSLTLLGRNTILCNPQLIVWQFLAFNFFRPFIKRWVFQWGTVMCNSPQKLWDNKKVIICWTTPALFYYLIHSFGVFHRSGRMRCSCWWYNWWLQRTTITKKIFQKNINIQRQPFVRKVQHTVRASYREEYQKNGRPPCE